MMEIKWTKGKTKMKKDERAIKKKEGKREKGKWEKGKGIRK